MPTREPLEDRELSAMLDTVKSDEYPTRDELIIHSLAFIGLRASALAHMTREWVDFQNRRVEVPSYQSCSAGRGGGPCSECVDRLERLRADPERVDSYAELRERAERFERYARRDGIGKRVLRTILDEYEGMWFPKSSSGARPIPVKDDDTWALIQDWFGAHDELMISRQTIGNVVRSVAADSSVTRSVNPHEFRHTYGTRLADMDFSAHEIKDAMGHATTRQAEDYIKLSGKRLDDAFEDKWSNLSQS